MSLRNFPWVLVAGTGLCIFLIITSYKAEHYSSMYMGIFGTLVFSAVIIWLLIPESDETVNRSSKESQ
jgi:hypothetical protein